MRFLAPWLLVAAAASPASAEAPPAVPTRDDREPWRHAPHTPATWGGNYTPLPASFRRHSFSRLSDDDLLEAVDAYVRATGSKLIRCRETRPGCRTTAFSNGKTFYSDGDLHRWWDAHLKRERKAAVRRARGHL
jgi:hypothetical protein